MKIKEIQIDLLKEYENNPRFNEESVKYVAESIKEFGFKVPVIIDKNNVIIAGHTRIKAAKQLGLKKVPCIVADDLTPEQVKAFRLADNKVSEFSAWDEDKLYIELMELKVVDFNVETFGFDTKEIDTSTANVDEILDKFENENTINEVEEDDFNLDDIPEEPVSKLGDIYQLGNHRLMCGDSTRIDDVEKLMNDEKADMVFTDPPYGVSYTGGVIHGNEINKDHKREMLKNDDIDIYADFIPLLNSIIEDGAIYIFYATCNSYELLKPLHENDIELNSIIVWNKINTGYADMNSNYKNKYEPCVYCKRKGHKLNFVGATNECTVWDIEKDRDNKLHPTQKPIAVPTRAIKNSSKKNNIVVDLFGGSGSTLIACEQLNRKCYMMELDPKYVDVIINRWETLTGEKAELIKEG